MAARSDLSLVFCQREDGRPENQAEANFCMIVIYLERDWSEYGSYDFRTRAGGLGVE